jgi:methylenetetrahydrofolate/methylenetetrahydromethanopterin dehydrogenase (NADP+)
MTLAKILVCLDTDPQPSVFDGVVAVDAGVDHLFRHGGVTADAVRDLVYGAMFTRGPADLKNTAVFIGGSDVDAGEALLAKAKKCFFGPMRVSLMLDSNGANTTAAAAVLSAKKHLLPSPSGRGQGEGALAGTHAIVLGATGSVGRRVVRLLAREGAIVNVASRQKSRAQEVCDNVRKTIADAQLTAFETQDEKSTRAAVDGAVVIIAAGAPGVELLSDSIRQECKSLKVAIDLNAVPPAGIAGIAPQDKAIEHDGQICYGAIGVGGLKMKVHKAAIRRLFESNDAVLDADEIYHLGTSI